MDTNINQLGENKPKLSFFKKLLIIIISISLLLGVTIYYLWNRFIAPWENINSLVYNTRSLKEVSYEPYELFELIGFTDRRISVWGRNNGLVRTKDNKFLFFSANKKDCSKHWSCSDHSYIVNMDKKTISNFKIDSINTFMTPVYKSLVAINDDGEILIYDAAQDKVIDRLPHSEEWSESILHFTNFSFSSGNYYTYTDGNVLYSRDINKHISTPVNNNNVTPNKSLSPNQAIKPEEIHQ